MTDSAGERKIDVAVIVGSDSDLPVMMGAARLLSEFDVSHEIQVMSAHRTPQLLDEYLKTLKRRRVQVVIAAAGKAAHLAGRIASATMLPVIGVPLDGGMNGLDALLSTVQMPGGVPVLTVGVGGAGATNAALGAIQILALGRPKLARRLAAYRRRMAKELARKNATLQKLGVEQYARTKNADG